MPPAQNDNEIVALLAVDFLGREDSRLNGLLSLAGMDAQDAKQALGAREPGFLGHVLAYLCSDERWAQAFAAEHDLAPEDLHRALNAFGSGQLMD